MKNLLPVIGLVSLLTSCKTSETKTVDNSIGTIERLDSAVNDIVGKNPAFDILGEGYKWSEGPVWVESEKMLLFSDVPNNIVHKWTEEKGVEKYLTPSGYLGTGTYSREPGSNGLTLSPDGKLVLCQHGDRRVAYMDAPFNQPEPKFVTLSDNFQGKKLNSPNDATFRSNGDLFFTDPPYGLPQQAEDPTKETPHNGVYKVSGGTTTLIVDSLTRPNGIAFLKGGKTLLVANSDSEKASWYAFDLDEKDSVVSSRIFYDATPNAKAGEHGLPDGLRVDSKGNVYATGPGGIWIFNESGKPIGRIRLSQPAANCELSADEKTLFITNNMYLVRVRLRD
jgi:gluconolactonase